MLDAQKEAWHDPAGTRSSRCPSAAPEVAEGVGQDVIHVALSIQVSTEDDQKGLVVGVYCPPDHHRWSSIPISFKNAVVLDPFCGGFQHA